MSIYKAFNKIFISLIDDCILVFPEDPNFKNYRKGAKILDQFNTLKPAQVYKKYSSMYRQYIDTKNEDFFLNNDYSKLNVVADDDEVTNFINNIKLHWNDLSTENKDKIWKYLNTLCLLTDKLNV